MQKENHTAVHEFLILGFQSLHVFKFPLFFLFLLIYIVTFLENLLIIVLVTASTYLHKPMYLILKTMSSCELFYVTSLVPKMLHDIQLERATISVIGCIVQLNIFGTMGMMIFLLYALMSYDRYLAISNPLQYSLLLDNSLCLQIIVVFGLVSFSSTVVISVLLSQLEFCDSNVIDHFFCDFSPLVELSCSDTKLVQVAATLSSGLVMLLALIFIIFSYIFIIFTILGIPSATGRTKSFSTCSSHLLVVTLNYGILISIYVLPARTISPYVNKGLSFIFLMITPLVNPIIYTLKNQEFHRALKTKVRDVKTFFDL